MADSTRCPVCSEPVPETVGYIDGAAYCDPFETSGSPLTCFEMAAWAMPAQLRVIAAMDDSDES